MKALYGVYAALTLLVAGGAVSAADPVPDQGRSLDKASQSACPRGPVSIYFSEGQSAASTESEELLVRVGKTAVDCHPVRVDLIAHLDPTEGDTALQLALDRLHVVSRELAAHGLPPLSIRVATEDPSQNLTGGVTGRQVDIHFRSTIAPVGSDGPVAPAKLVAPLDIPSQV
jgi:hypothetical protein